MIPGRRIRKIDRISRVIRSASAEASLGSYESKDLASLDCVILNIWGTLLCYFSSTYLNSMEGSNIGQMIREKRRELDFRAKDFEISGSVV